MPIPAARCYALMRTWPAPEMPRPGCVWTHVLLVAFADVARFAEMSSLTTLVTRPVFPGISHEYGEPIIVDPASLEEKKLEFATASDALQILRAVYSEQVGSVLAAQGRKREAALFKVWSQQWPRLRRSFSFQTSGHSSAASSRFSLRLVAGVERDTTNDAIDKLNNWERASLDDLQAPGDFRRFIWRYGSDIRRGRERFRFLANFFELTRLSRLDGEVLTAALDEVVHVLPDPKDGKLLKTDLVAAGTSDFSLLPPADLLDVLRYFFALPDASSLPPPALSRLDKTDGFWPSRADQILTIVEQAVTTSSATAQEVVEIMAASIDATTFATHSKRHPTAMLALAEANPQLLDSPGIQEVPPPYLSALIDRMPNDIGLAVRVLDHLMVLDDELVAKTFVDRFPLLTAERVFDRIARQLAGSGQNVPHNWMAASGPTLKGMLPDEVISRIETTSAMAACAILLDLNVAKGLTSTPRIWASTLARARDDVSGQPRKRLSAYLLALALAQPSRGCEPLFEFAFQQVHADIGASTLPYDAYNALARYLPNLYWWEQWDTCLRLRTAVAEAYVDNDLDPTSFRRVTNDHHLFKEMVDRAGAAKGGRRFINRLSGD